MIRLRALMFMLENEDELKAIGKRRRWAHTIEDFQREQEFTSNPSGYMSALGIEAIARSLNTEINLHWPYIPGNERLNFDYLPMNQTFNGEGM